MVPLAQAIMQLLVLPGGAPSFDPLNVRPHTPPGWFAVMDLTMSSWLFGARDILITDVT